MIKNCDGIFCFHAIHIPCHCERCYWGYSWILLRDISHDRLVETKNSPTFSRDIKFCEATLGSPSMEKGRWKNKKGILLLICGVEYSIFDKSNHDVHRFCLFTPLLRQSFCLFTPPFETRYLPFHTPFDTKFLPFPTPFETRFCFFIPQKTEHGKVKNGPPTTTRRRTTTTLSSPWSVG